MCQISPRDAQLRWLDRSCTVNVTVTGRAGTPGGYAYVYAEASFVASSVLQDAYFSNYEVLDPDSQTIQGYTVTTTSNAVPQSETTYDVTYSYVNGAGATVTVKNVSVWQAVCQYDTYSPNNFIDALQLTIGGTQYTNSHPYYGPLQTSNYQLSFQTNAQNVVVTSGGTNTVTLQSMPCAAPYDFVDGEVFDGPVYSNDQIHVCGSPTFNGAPVSLLSGAPDEPYAWNVPGSVNIGGNYYPQGYTTDGNCNPNPTLAHGVEIAQNQSLPSLNTQLGLYGTATPPTGTLAGCTYTGPTMIELVTTSSGTTKMDVWSPLSSSPTTTSTCSGGSTFSQASPFIQNIPLPADGVVYVQNYILPTGALAPSVNDGSAPCFNPYQEDLPADNPTCLEGDTYVEGELHGQLTIASAANIIITRDLTVNCVDGNGAAVVTNPDTVSNCTSENNPDILGLSAKEDVLVSHNDPSDQVTQSTQDCLGNGFRRRYRYSRQHTHICNVEREPVQRHDGFRRDRQ